ncbi:uncharacterized protein M421DRAFT_1452 [Didymella exigua CBS 183.55]|uniref:Uncharacterized protein n=1 Tax=Didymella exigua CBS 183.55 TaxID=1150837 RepID=A0A6A5RWT9_9PLEO|nr:uncharacterized protein M421DRAFT_1452 [Didymella exigua CBS 183.55]KAF1932871.1 hypothetical protein M421DRAFT_1452 [Didymella exigua CBS 183.55]
MTVSTDNTPMDISHDTSSSARSDSSKSDTVESTTTQPSSIDEYHYPNSPTRKLHAHISHFVKYLKPEHDGVFKLKDAIATALFNVAPETLTSFVDPLVGTFNAVFKGNKRLVVWRKGNAGFGRLEHLVGFSISWNGSWHIIVSAGNTFCEAKWPVVWTGPYEVLGGVYEMFEDKESDEDAKYERATLLAMRILEGKFWEATVNVKAV